MKKSESETPYALFHVNRRTGEKVRYPRDTFPADSRDATEARAKRSRESVGMSNAFPGDWETFAHPDVPDNVKYLDQNMVNDVALVSWLTTHGAGENMVTLVSYANSDAEVLQAGNQARLTDGRLVYVGHESPNQGLPGTRYVMVLAPKP